MTLGEKLRQIRHAEQLTQSDMASTVAISLDTYKNYELARRRDISALELIKITTHPRFSKYTLWMMADQTAPAAGQVSPV